MVSSVMAVWLASALPARAHEVFPAIADMEADGDLLGFDVTLNIESFIAGIDLTETVDTDEAPEADQYDALRALEPAELQARFDTFWPEMAQRIVVNVDGTAVVPALVSAEFGPVGNVDNVRETVIAFTAALPEGAQSVQVGWAKEFGTLVLRQQGVEAPYTGLLEAGAMSDPIALAGGNQASGWQTFVNYIPVGFDHIVPKGLDHILFVLGLFFLSTRLRPLLLQVTLFTLAHTITLAMAALGYVSIPGSIVEPLIAGLGFASVLGEFGLPEGAFIPALIGFNVGVEVGQLAVIAVMFLCVWQAIRVDRGENEAGRALGLYAVLAVIAAGLIWLDPAALSEVLENPTYVFAAPLLAIFALCSLSVVMRSQVDAYRRIVSIPASVFIALVGVYWVIERVFL